MPKTPQSPHSQALPIDPLLPRLCAALAHAPAVVLEATPGAGKTTRVPPALLQADFLSGQEILVLEPRRLAAKLAAFRVAEELGEPIGQSVGYQLRFEQSGNAATRIRFVTEGIFLRRILREPDLPGVGVVIIDEFHERHLQGDIALALIRRLQASTRPDLRLIVMSATLEGAPLAAYLNGPRLQVEGRRFPIAVEYVDDGAHRAIEDRVAGAVTRILNQGTPGDILVFFPGVGEILRARDHLVHKIADCDVLPLYADLSKAEQERAIRRGDRRKIVLCTNVAETSITIDGVTAVIDTGWARIAAHNPWTGLPSLRLSRISQAAAIQRAGRAGRTAPGHCLRLYPAADFQARAAFETPEIERQDLAPMLLELKALGIDDIHAMPWFTPPPAAHLQSAMELLTRLGALDAQAAITPMGHKMAAFPAHPRLGRMMVEAGARHVAGQAALLAAWLGESGAGSPPETEVVDLVEALEKAGTGSSEGRLRMRVRDQMLRSLPPAERTRDKTAGPATSQASADSLRQCVLAAFPDRIGRLRSVGRQLSRNRNGESSEVVMSSGATARMMGHAGQASAFVVAVDVDERMQGGLKGERRVRLVAAIEPEWLLELAPSPLSESVTAVWSEERQQVDLFSRLACGQLIVDESRLTPASSAYAQHIDKVERLLAEKAGEAGLGSFSDPEELATWRERLRLAHEHSPQAALVVPDETAERNLLNRLVAGMRTFAELRNANPLALWKAQLSAAQLRIMERHLPSTLQLPGGRRLRIHYERGKPPWAESRMQDFFGMGATPLLAEGKLPLVLHLLAPNGRAVQVTTDLAGFWQRTYPELSRELGRKYPRHAWPADPLTAPPSQPLKPRKKR